MRLLLITKTWKFLVNDKRGNEGREGEGSSSGALGSDTGKLGCMSTVQWLSGPHWKGKASNPVWVSVVSEIDSDGGWISRRQIHSKWSISAIRFRQHVPKNAWCDYACWSVAFLSLSGPESTIALTVAALDIPTESIMEMLNRCLNNFCIFDDEY